ncbi:MAG: TRAP transporter substrate-binding protein DctP [Deltaproteobacteria bacterium]|nr:TRAP transporter substrate-binding protein DctP [Deltaproteobacteria bacterium]
MARSSRLLPVPAFLALGLAAASAAAEPVVLKISTVAPKDSPWMAAYTAMAKEVETATGGNVTFKFYPGMVSGDEKDMVRKMRGGQIQGAGLTGVGLQMIEPNTLVLQMPLMFQTYPQLDFVRDKLAGRFQEMVKAKGFVILGWSDIGYTYIFTQTPVSSLASFNGVKMWGWEDEPISKAFFETAGIAQVSLSLPDVLPGLQRGMINGVYNSPLGAIALQWDKYTRYVTKLAISIGIGATVVTKAEWDRIPADQQAKILEIAGKHHADLRKVIRAKNKEAIAQLKKQGIQLVDVPQPEVDRMVQIAAKVRANISAKMFKPGLLQEVEGLLKQAPR